MPRLFSILKDLDRREKRLLILLGAAFFITNYDLTILTLALPDVQASFEISEGNLGNMIAVIRLGAIPGLLLALMADRIGRRRLLMVTLIGLSVASLATSFAQSTTQFVIFQSFARLFGTLEEILAVIFALEMLPARHRGWGVGFLAAMGGLGSGVGSLLYSGVDILPGGWRAMYALGGLAIIGIAWQRRNLPESPLFEQHSLAQLGASFWEPLREIFTYHRRAMLAMGVISLTFWFQVIPSLNFMSKFLQTQHDYSPGQVSLLFIVAGTIAVLGNVAAGRLSDIVGRRPLLALGIVVNCGAFLTFYNVSGLLLPIVWIAALFSYFVVDVISYALSGELFPTSCRSTAATLRILFSVLGAAAGLMAESTLYTQLGSHAAALSIMTLTSLVGLPVIALWLRETANTRLN